METIERYDSKIEKSVLELEHGDEGFLLWLRTSEKRENEILSFDMIPDHETAYQVIDWYKQQELRGVGLTAAFAHLHSQVETAEKIQQAASGRKIKVN
jgi:hypothetical protein